MSRTTITILSSLLVLVILGMFAVSYFGTSTIDEVVNDADADLQTEPTDTDSKLSTINAKHFFVDGVHTFVGEIDMPTPCDLLDHEVEVRESFPEQVHINFTVVNSAEMCAQVITPQRFMVAVDASEDATFSATLQGEPVTINLIPAGPDETPEDFELFIKG